MDVPDDEIVTVQRTPDEIRDLLRFGGDAEEETKVMSPPDDLLRGGDDLDALLASSEEQSLPPPPPGPASRIPLSPMPPRAQNRLPDFTPRRTADSLLESSLEPSAPKPRLPLPPPAPPAPVSVPREPPVALADTALPEVSLQSIESLPELNPADIDSHAAYAPPSKPPPRYAAKLDTDSVVANQGKKGGDMARLVLVLGITLPLAVGIGVVIGMLVFGSDPAPPPVAGASTEAPRAAPAAASTPAEKSLIERAIEGDHAAADELRKRPPESRTARETIALAQARSTGKRLGLEGFAAQIKKNPALLDDPAQRARLKEFLSDRETTNLAALVLLELEGPLGPDLVYDLWVGTKGKNETTTLAEELVYSKEMRQKASPALNVALDLRVATECEQIKELLPKAHEHGDRRSLHLLGKLVNKRGCGPQKRDDCYACIRPLDDDDAAIDLLDAIKAVRGRAPPKL